MRRDVRMRWAVGAVAVVVAALLLVFVGRHEGRHEEQRQRNQLTSLFTLVGSRLDASNLSGYRFDSQFDCLTYQVGDFVFALQFCFDSRGALVEAADRRGVKPIYWSLAYKPSAAPILVDPAQLAAVVAEIKKAKG